MDQRVVAERIRPTVATAAALVLLALPVGLAGPARAQEQPPPAEETTTSEAPPAEPAPPSEVPPTSAPPPLDLTPPEEPVDDSGPPEVPTEEVVVPPEETPPPPDPMAPLLQQMAGISLAEVQKSLRQTAAARATVARQVGGLRREVADLEARLAALQSAQAQAVARYQQARLQLRNRAVAGYMGSPVSPINQILDAADFNELSRRFGLLRSVMEADRSRIDEYQAARDSLGRELEGVVAELDTRRSALLVAGSALDGADSAVLAKEIQLAAIRAGGAAVGAGFVFPVGGPRRYADTFGAPRMFGTAFAHLHQGTDIFAASGTPLLAVERGVLIRVGTDTLGGTKLWLVGASGTRYYYAHLSAFAEGVVEGKVVQAGDVVGFVGNTGNAASTPAHLHFEVHPNGGPAVNPYPLLRIVDEAQKRLAGVSADPDAPPGGGPRS